MSTRACIHFTYGSEIIANIYRHGDGYPDTKCGVIADLKRFFSAVAKQTKGGMGGTRFDDPSYLSAKFVVWQAGENAKSNQYKRVEAGRSVLPLDFISLGITNDEPGDLAYVYTVDCLKLDAKGRPTVSYTEYNPEAAPTDSTRRKIAFAEAILKRLEIDLEWDGDTIDAIGLHAIDMKLADNKGPEGKFRILKD